MTNLTAEYEGKSSKIPLPWWEGVRGGG